VHAPKACGAWTVQAASAALPLHACTLYSSVAALLGGAGQANYSAANSCLDALAACRRRHGQRGASLQWGPWAGVGMAADASVHARMQAAGITLLTLAEGVCGWRAALDPRSPAVAAVINLRWSRYLGALPEVPALLRSYAAHRPAKPAKAARGAAATAGAAKVAVTPATLSTTLPARHAATTRLQAVSLEDILASIESTTGNVVSADSPLLDSGLDSLGAVELKNQLQEAAGSERGRVARPLARGSRPQTDTLEGRRRGRAAKHPRL